MLDRATSPSKSTMARLRPIVPEPLPVAEFVRGRSVAEVAELLPRLFNLCAKAQSVAIRMALGLGDTDTRGLADEIRGEHLLRLAISLPNRLGLDPVPFPRNDTGRLPEALFGDTAFPDSVAAFERFVESGIGVAAVLRAIRDRFRPGEAASGFLRTPWDASVFSNAALENSVAARHLDHPVMRHVEAGFGRGPLWRVTARAIDLQAAIEGALPAPRLIAPGAAVVPAARGLYAVRARVAAGRVIDLVRVTPTDHLLAPGGILAQSLATLPDAKKDLGDLLVDLLDPCCAVRLEEVTDA